MNRSRLKRAGFITLVNALLAVPLFFLSAMENDRQEIVSRAVDGSTTIVSLVLTVYILRTLQSYLHGRYRFTETDALITVLVRLNMVAAACGLTGNIFPTLEEGSATAVLFLAVAIGAAQLFLGLRLLRISDPLTPLFRPFCWFTAASGFLFASVVLLPAGVVTDAVSNVMLATMFMQTADRLPPLTAPPARG